MMSVPQEERQQRNFKNLNIRFSIRFNYLLFPFDVVDLIGQLSRAGYTSTIPPQPRFPGKKIRLGATGTIAQKGDIRIDINDQRGILGAESSSSEFAVKGLNEVLQIIRDNLNIDLNEMASFYELIAHFDIETHKNALEKIEQISEKSKYTKQFSELLNEDTADYSLRLVPRGRAPNQTEWFDVTIEPDVIRPFSSYSVVVVYRSKDKFKVEKFIQDLMQNMRSIIDIIES